jgi:hypothetical protein
VKRAKQWLLDLGLEELAGKVTIICIDLFKPKEATPHTPNSGTAHYAYWEV